MSTTETPTSTPDSDAIAATVNAYTPSSLNDAQAAQAVERLRYLVLAAGPRSVDDARALYASASRFLADVAPPEGCDVDALLTEVEVARWSNTRAAAGANPGTLANRHRHLERLLRAAAGHPPRTVATAPTKTPRAINDRDELMALAGRLAVTDPQGAAALVAAAGAGLVASHTVGCVVADDATTMKTPTGNLVRVVEPWQHIARRVSGVVVDNRGWTRARAASDPSLDAHAVYLSWVVCALDDTGSVAAAMAVHGLRRTVLDAVAATLSPVDADTTDRLLRGDTHQP